MANSEVIKLQQHLSLLQQEYSKLQKKYEDLEGRCSSNFNNGFALRLVNIISGLHASDTFSDIRIKLAAEETVPAHKLVLAARSKLWDEQCLKPLSELDWSDINLEVAKLIILWLYKGEVKFISDELTLLVMRQAFQFKIEALVESCEHHLISTVDTRSCVKFYSAAEEIQAANLKEYCSGLISTHWDELNSSDFEDMSGPLLYSMLKNKTQLPLHSAVRLLREDVVFLCLLENSNRLADIVNVWSQHGELPLDLALTLKNHSIADTLVQHHADLNISDPAGECLLYRAIKRGNSFGALFLLEHKCDVNLVTREGNDSALHLVAGSVQLEENQRIARELIKSGIDVNARNRLGYTALHVAVQSDNRAVFDALIAHDQIDVNLKTNDGHPPLYFAYSKLDLDVPYYVQELIQRGAKLDPIYANRLDLLQTLIVNGKRKAASHLVQKLTDLDHVNMNGETALHLCCQRGYDDVATLLLERGANPSMLTNEQRLTPVHYAVKSNSAECLRAFINNNNKTEDKRFNMRDVNGDTPLSLALGCGFKGLVPLLIKGGADINVRNGQDLTLLHQAIMKEDAETALYLLQHGADVNALTSHSETPLQLAIYYKLPEVVDALCSKGVDMSVRDGAGVCALWATLESGEERIANILVKHGADTDCWTYCPDVGYRQTLLHRAIDENKEEAAIFLIRAGCDLQSPRIPEGGSDAVKDLQTPLHLCCVWGLEPVARALIEHGANVSARDAELRTPLHCAIENRQEEIIDLLLNVPEIDLSLLDKNGLSPFACALTHRNHKAARAILDKQPTASEQYDSRGRNFLHVAVKNDDVESTLFLLTVNVDVNSRVRDAIMTPPLHLAARYSGETLLRSLILAGARVNDRDAQKRTALHVAAEAGNSAAVAALLQNNIDYDAVDMAGDNALHVAVREGHVNVARTLLTESRLNAEQMNVKGRNPLHELCRCNKDNVAAVICELFLECMPEYPINAPDVYGNSPLLLAYMKGNGNLCRVLVKANACLGAENADKVTVFNYQVPSKQLLTKMLDQVCQPAPWAHTDGCQECGKGFSITVRPHHCRHCGRSLCNRCSDQEVPIVKFNEHKPVRVCQVCFNVLKTGVC
ncbi:rabankyrin-5 [Anthonomus grandis grandis]|uniref:rabankyrin-5 n=1 Tax=Anthonomus grandis grandis TaxID=2921223 RepID=UPI002165ED60|nr:rabankyrin-5 [Anthonomus grandis grandis]